MSGAWSSGDVLSLSSGPWVQDPDGAWRVVPDDEAVALSAEQDTADDDLTDAEREALAGSPEWAAYVTAEVADLLHRHGLA